MGENDKTFVLLGFGGLISGIAFISYKVYKDYRNKNVKSIGNLKPGMKCSIEGYVRNSNNKSSVNGEIY